jgi:hypothetical protein
VMPSHGLPTEDTGVRHTCATCYAKLPKGEFRACGLCLNEHLGISERPMEEREAYWNSVMEKREERKIRNASQ